MKYVIFAFVLIYSIEVFPDRTPIDQILRTIETSTGCKMIVTSGFRTKAHNTRVGGAKNSFHLYGRALDIVPKDKKCISIKKLGKIACKITSVITYKYHAHIDNRAKPLCILGRYK
jgi:hypothetical protein